MEPEEIRRLVEIVADKLEGRLCAKGAAPSEAERLAQLRADLQALAVQFSVRNEVIAQVRAEVAEHGFVPDKGSQGQQHPDVERLLPPDFGPQGPSDEDIQREIEEIMRKIQRLRNPGKDDYEFKLPFRVQINVAFLVSILLELLKLIMKLLERMRRGPQPQPAPPKRR